MDLMWVPIPTRAEKNRDAAPWSACGADTGCLAQGEAIAMNLREMFGLRVPVISVVIGEGGSGGALAIGCANWNLIMEHSVYYVASPEACAAILWKSRAKAGAVRFRDTTYADSITRFRNPQHSCLGSAGFAELQL